MGLRGSVRAFGLDQLLEFLSASGHRGSLAISHKEVRKTLFLHDGGLYVERSTWSFRLGDALVRRGEITHEQLENALAKQKEATPGGEPAARLGDILVERGQTTPERILSARRFQVEEEIYELFGWEDAFFEFTKDALPPDFEKRLTDPEEFRFDVRSVLLEASRRLDEWHAIREALPSEKRLLTLSDKDDAFERATTALVTAGARRGTPDGVFDGRTPVGDLPRLLGLSKFEAQALATRLIRGGDVRPLLRHELESRLRPALETDLKYALTLYESALESPEFEARGRFLDRVLFGNATFRDRASTERLMISSRMSGKRAFEMLLGLLRQQIPCEYVAHEEARVLSLGLAKSALVWRVPEGAPGPNIIKHLLAKHPIPDADLHRAREMQRESGRTLQQILVGGGFISMETWFRAQKDAVLDEMFGILFLRRPYVEVKTGTWRGQGNPKLDVDVPMLPWLQAEVMREIRQWEVMAAQIPSARAIFALTGKGEKSLTGPDDPLQQFDGMRSLEELLQTQQRPPAEFFAWVYEKIESGRLRGLEPDEYTARIDACVEAGKRSTAVSFCVAAIESLAEASEFRDRLRLLEAQEAEVAVRSSRHVLRGDIASFSLAEVLQSFHMAKRSGTLTVEVKTAVESRSRQIYFDQGEIYLLAGGSEASSSEDEGSKILAAANLTEDQLEAATATQMKDEVYEIFIWDGAEFEFSADNLPSEFYASSRRRRVRLKTTNFLLEAVRRIAEWEEVRKIIPRDDLVVAFPSSQKKLEALQAARGSQDLLLLVDGQHPIADLVRTSGMHRFRALPVLAELLQEGVLQLVDPNARRTEDERAIVATSLPTSGVIESGFVGQLQFVGTLQDLASARLTGVLRLTDGRRSKEMALVEGVPYRTSTFRPRTPVAEGNGALAKAAAIDTAQDVSECFSWQGARFELLVGTLPPKLTDAATRKPMELDVDAFFDAFAEAGERWGAVAEHVPRDRPVAFTSDEARESGGSRVSPDVLKHVDGKKTPEEIARLSGRRYESLSWLATMFEEGLVEVVDPKDEGGADEKWDLSL